MQVIGLQIEPKLYLSNAVQYKMTEQFENVFFFFFVAFYAAEKVHIVTSCVQFYKMPHFL